MEEAAARESHRTAHEKTHNAPKITPQALGNKIALKVAKKAKEIDPALFKPGHLVDYDPVNSGFKFNVLGVFGDDGSNYDSQKYLY